MKRISFKGGAIGNVIDIARVLPKPIAANC